MPPPLNDWLSAHSIETVECLVPDLYGNGRGKAIPAKSLDNGSLHIPEAVFGQTILGEWCEDPDLIGDTDADVSLAPVAETLCEVPWLDRPVAQVVCDCIDRTGAPLEFAPRQVLKRVVTLFEQRGLTPVVAQEAEFYLVQRNTDPATPLEPATGVSGRPETAERSYHLEALADFEDFIQTLEEYAQVQRIALAGVLHEGGPAQLEVNFTHGDPLTRADQMFLFKRLVRQAAMANGWHATFMAKPMDGAAGNSMHIHQSLVDAQGRNAFYDHENRRHGQALLHYIAGLQTHTPAAIALFAPNVNSYRRFEDGDSSPINLHWGYDNRTTGFRIPDSDPAGTRVENRLPGADANPYLAVAASLLCGYLGMVAQTLPDDPIPGDAWEMPRNLPRNLPDALDLLEGSEPLRIHLGERFVALFVDVKRREADAFNRTVTAWEREHLLLTV